MDKSPKNLQNLLHKALLQEGEMSQALYEFNLQEHVEDWKKDMKRDKDDYLFVLAENSGHIAMILITKEGEIFINEKAREKLQFIWRKDDNYKYNMERLIPGMVEDLSDGFLAVNGVKTAIRF